MYSNRRREHIHIIRQSKRIDGNYTGTRIVIFRSDRCKLIKDYDNFIRHKYINSKSKINIKSLWKIECSMICDVVKKVMVNTNEGNTLEMKHILYESSILSMNKYYKDVFKKEGIEQDAEIIRFIEGTRVI